MSSLLRYVSGVAKSPTNTNINSGDARYEQAADVAIELNSLALEVGILSGVKQTLYAMAAHFDTSSIPLGAQIDRTQFVLLPSTTVSTSMTIDVSVLALSTRLDAVDVQYHDALMIYYPDIAVWPATSISAWSNGSKTGEQDVNIALYENQRDGVQSVSQAWTAYLLSASTAVALEFRGSSTPTSVLEGSNAGAGAAWVGIYGGYEDLSARLFIGSANQGFYNQGGSGASLAIDTTIENPPLFVRMRLRRVAAGDETWNGKLYFILDSGSASETKRQFASEPDWSLGWVTVTWDMTTPDAGIWTNNANIGRFRFDLTTGGTSFGSVFDIASIIVDDGTSLWPIGSVDDGTVYNHWVRGGQVGLHSDARVRANVYTAKGSAGSYRKGALLAEGALTDVSAWGTTVTSQMLANANTDWTPVLGEVYVTEIELIPGLSSSTGALYLGWSSTLDGSVENETAYAAPDKKIQGFGSNRASAQWESGIAIRDAADIGITDTISAHNPISGYVSLFSSAEYDSNILVRTLTNFKANMQLALDDRDRTDQWIGLRMQNFSATAGQIRSYHGIYATSAPDTFGGKKGWVLEIYYTLPFKTIELAGDGRSSKDGLTGAGASSQSLSGNAVSSSLLVGSGASEALLSGTGTSVKELPQ